MGTNCGQMSWWIEMRKKKKESVKSYKNGDQ